MPMFVIYAGEVYASFVHSFVLCDRTSLTLCVCVRGGHGNGAQSDMTVRCSGWGGGRGTGHSQA